MYAYSIDACLITKTISDGQLFDRFENYLFKEYGVDFEYVQLVGVFENLKTDDLDVKNDVEYWGY